MTTKQARLVAAVSDAMAAQNFSQNNLSRVSGVGQSMISAALLGKYDLREEKWRMICEALAVDYDDIVRDPVPEEQLEANDEVRQDQQFVSALRELQKDRMETVDVHEKYVMGVVSRYLARKLAEDIRTGTDMSLDELYHLLSICKSAQEIAQE